MNPPGRFSLFLDLTKSYFGSIPMLLRNEWCIKLLNDMNKLIKESGVDRIFKLVRLPCHLPCNVNNGALFFQAGAAAQPDSELNMFAELFNRTFQLPYLLPESEPSLLHRPWDPWAPCPPSPSRPSLLSDC